MHIIEMKGRKDAASMDDVLSRIRNADDIEISQIIEAVVERYSLVYPDWEVMFTSLPKNDAQQRKLYIENLIAFLNKMP